MTSTKLNFWRRMAAAAPDDPMCCHFAIARNLSSKQLSPGVEARDKLLLEMIEEQQEKIFKKEGLAATDKGKKELKTVLGLVRSEVESCAQHGLLKLVILTKNGGIIGGIIYIGGAEFSGFSFIVDKKKKKNKVAITVQVVLLLSPLTMWISKKYLILEQVLKEEDLRRPRWRA